MKERELYLDRIELNDKYSIQIDESQKYVNLYLNNNLLEQFSLRRTISTFFKFLQSHLHSENVIKDRYGEGIKIHDDLYMRLTDKYHELMVEFYHYDDNNKHVLFTTKTNYMTQKLFSMILVPEKAKIYPQFIIDPQNFKEIIDILSMIKI